MKEKEGGVFLQSKTIWLIRGLGIFVALIVPPFRYAFPAELYDPMAFRLVISAFATGIVVSSFLWKGITKYALTLTYLFCFVLTLWMLSLALLNQLAQEYVASYFIVLFASLFLFRNWTWLLVLISLNGILAFVTIPFLEAPTFNPIAFLALTNTIFVISVIGLWTGMVEYRSVSEREKLLGSINKAAFASAVEAILVTDSNGLVLHFNEVFRTFWNIQHLEFGDESAESWMPSIQKSLLDPMLIVSMAQRAFRQLDEPIAEMVQLTDGRYVKILARPVIQEEQTLGRIWFFRDVTTAQLNALSMQKAQERLRLQNETLVRLAKHDVMHSGNFHLAQQLVTMEVAQALVADRVGIWRLEEDVQTLVCEDIYFTSTGHHACGAKVFAGQSPDYFAKLSSERVIHIPNANQNPLTSSFELPYLSHGKPRNIVDAPLRIGGRLYGVLSAERDGLMHDWSTEDQQFLASMGDILAVLLESEERRKAEGLLANLVVLNRAVFESAGVGILVTGKNQNVLDCNEVYLEVFGIDRDFVMGGESNAVMAYCRDQTVDPDTIDKSMQFLISHPNENDAQNLVFKDGRIVERFTEVLQVGGEVVGRVWFYRDITERMRVENAIMESERGKNAIIEAIPDLMLRVQEDGQVLDYKLPGSSGMAAFVYEKDSQALTDIFELSFAQEIHRNLRVAIEKQEVFQYETELTVQGNNRDFEARIAPSGPKEALVILRDVTERKKTERELMQRNHELDSFVYRASHDLKAPLNSLMGLIEILKLESQDPKLETYLKLMDKSVLKLDTFIRNLTEFSKIARLEIRNQAVDFNELLFDVNEGLRYMENAERVEKEMVMDDGPSFIGDSFHVGIVLGNLISNAIKYQDLKKANPWVKVRVTTTIVESLITVEDNGLGIPEIHQGRIFELFYRASNQSFGSGLGLYITRNAVEKMGGVVEMSSQEGVGTKFEVRLPNLNFGVAKISAAVDLE